jgi:hypothetical protein
MASSEKEMKRMEDDLLLLSKLYTATLGTLEDILVLAGVKMAPEKAAQRVLVVKAITDWYEEQKKNTDGGAAAYLIINECLGPELKQTENSAGKQSQASLQPAKLNPFRKEFKIHGSVEPKRGLAFVSLARQIDSGVRKGYSDIEIVDGVVRAVPLGSGLRNYLEGRPALKLSSLRKILRAQYREKSATELYNLLGQLAQGSAEDAQEFLLRALEIRQKILFASQEEEAEVTYEEKLVNKMFNRAMYTGLRNEVIRAELKPLLDATTIDEEEIIQRLCTVASKEDERAAKIQKSVKTPKVCVNNNTVESEEPVDTKKKPVKEGTFTCELRELKAEIAALREVVNATQKDTPTNSSRRQRNSNRGCPSCRERGEGSCNHCWHCGSAEHYKAGCRQARTNRRQSAPAPENGPGALRRD